MRRGEQMMEIVMKRAKIEKMEEIYVTMFPTEKLTSLVRLFEKYGFRRVTDKLHHEVGGLMAEVRTEWVMVKAMVNGEG